MTGTTWADVLIGVGAGVLLIWLALIAMLVILRPRKGLLWEALRLLPDTLRLLRRLAADPDMPRAVRLWLVALLTYLALPIDLVPDFVPVLGYADDAIIVFAALRSLLRRAGIQAVRQHWPGTDDGFAALCRLTGLSNGQPPSTQRTRAD